MDEQMQDDQLEPTYNSSVPIQDIAKKTNRKWWTIEKGGRRGLGRSTLVVWHDDDDDDPCAEMLSMYSVAPDDWTIFLSELKKNKKLGSNCTGIHGKCMQ